MTVFKLPCPRCGNTEYEHFKLPGGFDGYMCLTPGCHWPADDRSFRELDHPEPRSILQMLQRVPKAKMIEAEKSLHPAYVVDVELETASLPNDTFIAAVDPAIPDQDLTVLKITKGDGRKGDGSKRHHAGKKG